MGRFVRFVAAGLTVATLAAGCTNAELKKLRADNIALQEKLEALGGERVKLAEAKGSLQSQLAAMRDQNGKLQNQNASLEDQIKYLKSELAKAPAAAPQLPPLLKSQLEQFVKENGDLVSLVGDRVRFKSDILFMSGSANVSKKGQVALKKFAEIFQNAGKGLFLRIDGHTDTDPIKRTKDKYRDNWDLGHDRAYEVCKIMFDAGLGKDLAIMASHGEYSPLATGGSKDAKAKNRRVEILIVPVK